MGSDATIYVFDHSAYVDEVVPAIDRYVERGDRAEWLDALITKLTTFGLDYSFDRNAGLGYSFREVCTYLETSFAYRSVADVSDDWDRRACRSTECPARSICPLHIATTNPGAEAFNVLLEASVHDRCLGGEQFLGRTVSASFYTEMLADMGIGRRHPIFDFLDKLEYRGYVVGYQWSTIDGIHGWLTFEESRAFLELLRPLELPAMEQTFEAMKAFHVPANGYQTPAPFAFEHLSLAFLRTVTAIAVDESKGILWGNNLVDPEWIDRDLDDVEG